MPRATLSAFVLGAALFAPLSLLSKDGIGLTNPSELEGEAEADDTSHATPATMLTAKSRWSFSFESLYAFHHCPNPWWLAAGRWAENKRRYHLATEFLAIRYQLTPDCGPLFLRGNLELSIGPTATAFIAGPESYFAGAVFGGRYNFVQPGARLVPYIELRGGAGASDARGLNLSLQNELTFTYLIGAGLRYDINARYGVTLGVTDQHFSNAWFAHPDFGFDAVGVSMGMQFRY